jgi:predicted alpha/beta superfamily hydrolase
MRRLRLVALAALALGCAHGPAGTSPAATPAANTAPPAARGAGLTIGLIAPTTTPATATVYVAGNFNGWNPGNPAYALTRHSDGRYSIALPDSVRGPIEFKFTLGSWQSVELTATGGDMPNRGFTIPPTGPATWGGSVAMWRDGSKPAMRPSTARPTVTVLDTAFMIPQLRRARRVWLYLPPDYASSSKRYPVIYMHDGQNVFDNATSFAGEWGVDETLDSLKALGDPGAIVVAVDHGGSRRFDEYYPWVNAKYGGGEGDEYVDFLANTLKPWIDQHYRTRPDRLNTAVIGSSMGGLISLYALIKYPEVFGRAGVFSPAFWVAPELFAFARRAKPVRPDPRIYFVIGGHEAANADEAASYVDKQRQMIDTLAAAGFQTTTEIRALVRPEGTHSEGFWRREFPAAYQWLFR